MDLPGGGANGIELRSGPLRLAIAPAVGGSLAGLWHEGTPVLRSVEPGALREARQSACFPLVPYSNRLAHCSFSWAGEDHSTQPNFEGSPHSLHGNGWLRPWTVLSQDDAELVLGLRHTPDAHWPFAFEARQQIRLRPDALELDLAVTNRHGATQPMGLGWHPYFPRRRDSRLDLQVRERWDNDAAHLPTRPVPQASIDAPVASLDLDHCFAGWEGSARVVDEAFDLCLRSSLRHVVVFTPPGRGHFCVEPVSHLNDAIHRPDPVAEGLVALAPGATTRAWMRLEVARA